MGEVKKFERLKVKYRQGLKACSENREVQRFKSTIREVLRRYTASRKVTTTAKVQLTT